MRDLSLSANGHYDISGGSILGIPFLMDSLTRKSNCRQLTIQTASQAATLAIREAIISGELNGGDRMIEQKWAARLGIGQATLREALHELEHQGLLHKLPHRGTYVAQLSPEDFRLIQEVRIPLEAIAIGRAAENLTADAENELTAIVNAMTGNGVREKDVMNFHDCDVAFHRKIWELAGNPCLRNTLETITFRLFAFSDVGRWPCNPKTTSERLVAVQQHLGILEGLRARDGDLARQAFEKQTVQYRNMQYRLKLDEQKDVSS